MKNGVMNKRIGLLVMLLLVILGVVASFVVAPTTYAQSRLRTIVIIDSITTLHTGENSDEVYGKYWRPNRTVYRITPSCASYWSVQAGSVFAEGYEIIRTPIDSTDSVNFQLWEKDDGFLGDNDDFIGGIRIDFTPDRINLLHSRNTATVEWIDNNTIAAEFFGAGSHYRAILKVITREVGNLEAIGSEPVC